jgi:subtilisin-like proprotein convertase family protein
LKRNTHALIAITALGVFASTLVTGLASSATAARASYGQDGDLTIRDRLSAYNQNVDGITIPDRGDAAPHPSQITFSGETGSVVDVDVYLGGVTHDEIEDLDIMLVGPGGQQATVLSDAGGATAVDGAYMIFDDQASTQLTASNVGSDTYRPTNLDGADSFGAPAPTASGASALSVFNGGSPNGTWSLYVADDEDGTAGSIDGWALDLTTQDGTADPYPSTLTVANALPVVTDVNVTLSGFSHTYTDDVDILLVGPGGQQATLLSDGGGGDEVTDLTFTFDDEAATAQADEDPYASGTFKPANYEDDDSYPAPAPTATQASSLAVFDGTNPNGSWRLFVVDDAGGDIGSLSGWSLSLDAVDPAAPAGTVAINAGAAGTKTSAVTLNVNANDPAPASGVTQMRFSNDGASYSAWMPYATSTAWQLPAGDGSRTVWAQFSDAGGNVSAAATDTITVDVTAPGARKFKPGKGADGVDRAANVKVKATEALNPATVTKSSVVLKGKGSSKKVRAKVLYKAAKRQIVLDPKKKLDKNTTYKVLVKTTVKDAIGNAFDAKSKPGAQPLKWKFTTS